jgi:polynucleotide 5'-kinase involved in rRNA processing
MAESSEEKQCAKPVCIITLGMAGSGKTTFVQVVLEWE